jgi:hypothetical protein
MAKALPPGEIKTKAGKFIVNVLPDPFDERDLEYRPRLQPLPPNLLPGKKKIILEQKGSSCVGHALAAMINTILAHAPDAPAKPVRVSPYMLYWLARRYDEFEGEEDIGSSLRGGLKGWFNHGCAIEKRWPTLEMVKDLDDKDFQDHCAERPLGAFYRINPYRLDDMQSAISELNVIVASAAIHNGWEEPTPLRKGGETIHTILPAINPKALGGHAFALVGYNEAGFLVQNSWGTGWGEGGFATLPYEDWLDSAYDAWVARPGVPRTPFAAGRNRAAAVTGGGIATGPGPDLRRLKSHVVNLGNDGRLSKHGKFISSPAQIEEIFKHMDEVHRDWTAKGGGTTRHVVLYAHGGLVSETGGLETAEKHLNWWLNNRVYPISFAWQSGPAETLVDHLVDAVQSKLPFGGIGFDVAEQFDRLVEKLARTNFRWMWDEMKENARLASKALPAGGISWPPGPANGMAEMPGASLTVNRLAKYVKANSGRVAVHLVGHSAGSVFHAALLERLAQARIPVETLSLLAPGIRVDEFRKDILPHLGTGKTVRRTGVLVLSDRREVDDTVGTSAISIYQKSLLYLVSRALERLPRKESFEVPLLGMARFFDADLDAKLLSDLTGAGGDLVIAPSEGPGDRRSDSRSHGGFDDDSPTMTSVILRILGKTEVSPENVYRSRAPLVDPVPAAAAAAAARPTRGRAAAAATAAKAASPRAAAAASPGETPIVETAAAPAVPPTPPAQDSTPVVEVASAPLSGRPILDMMLATGWKEAGETARKPTKGAAKKKGD